MELNTGDLLIGLFNNELLRGLYFQLFLRKTRSLENEDPHCEEKSITSAQLGQSVFFFSFHNQALASIFNLGL